MIIVPTFYAVVQQLGSLTPTNSKQPFISIIPNKIVADFQIPSLFSRPNYQYRNFKEEISSKTILYRINPELKRLTI